MTAIDQHLTVLVERRQLRRATARTVEQRRRPEVLIADRVAAKRITAALDHKASAEPAHMLGVAVVLAPGQRVTRRGVNVAVTRIDRNASPPPYTAAVGRTGMVAGNAPVR